MSQKKVIAPSNNKALFHTFAALYETVANDDTSLEKADILIKIGSAAQRSLEYELKRTATQVLAGDKEARIRNVELKAFYEEDPKQLEEGE